MANLLKSPLPALKVAPPHFFDAPGTTEETRKRENEEWQTGISEVEYSLPKQLIVLYLTTHLHSPSPVEVCTRAYYVRLRLLTLRIDSPFP